MALLAWLNATLGALEEVVRFSIDRRFEVGPSVDLEVGLSVTIGPASFNARFSHICKALWTSCSFGAVDDSKMVEALHSCWSNDSDAFCEASCAALNV